MNCIFCQSTLIPQDTILWQRCPYCPHYATFTFAGYSHDQIKQNAAYPSSYSFFISYLDKIYELWFYKENNSAQLGAVKDYNGLGYTFLLKINDPPQISPNNAESYLIQLLNLKLFY